MMFKEYTPRPSIRSKICLALPYPVQGREYVDCRYFVNEDKQRFVLDSYRVRGRLYKKLYRVLNSGELRTMPDWMKLHLPPEYVTETHTFYVDVAIKASSTRSRKELVSFVKKALHGIETTGSAVLRVEEKK